MSKIEIPSHTFALVNGPNLNLLGLRDPAHYGKTSLIKIEERCKDYCDSIGLDLTCFQTNHEGQLLDFLEQLYYSKCLGLVINPAAWTNSIALYDSLEALSIPFVEVHMSAVSQRDLDRQSNRLRKLPNCLGYFEGLKEEGYLQAFKLLNDKI